MTIREITLLVIMFCVLYWAHGWKAATVMTLAFFAAFMVVAP